MTLNRLKTLCALYKVAAGSIFGDPSKTPVNRGGKVLNDDPADSGSPGPYTPDEGDPSDAPVMKSPVKPATPQNKQQIPDYREWEAQELAESGEPVALPRTTPKVNKGRSTVSRRPPNPPAATASKAKRVWGTAPALASENTNGIFYRGATKDTGIRSVTAATTADDGAVPYTEALQREIDSFRGPVDPQYAQRVAESRLQGAYDRFRANNMTLDELEAFIGSNELSNFVRKRQAKIDQLQAKGNLTPEEQRDLRYYKHYRDLGLKKLRAEVETRGGLELIRRQHDAQAQARARAAEAQRKQQEQLARLNWRKYNYGF